MAMLGPYYSHTLMNALLAHSVRWGIGDEQTRQLLSAYDNGKVFARQAWDGIFKELREGVCTISTVQALLLLSAQECSHGNSTQAWVCTGIAFRLIDHLGISFDSQRFLGSVALSDEDSEIRRRLFWSCYFWDKLMSLYLGRSPSLQQSPASPPQRIRKLHLNIVIVTGEFANCNLKLTIRLRTSCGRHTVSLMLMENNILPLPPILHPHLFRYADLRSYLMKY
jgi:hypothetical protein